MKKSTAAQKKLAVIGLNLSQISLRQIQPTTQEMATHYVREGISVEWHLSPNALDDAMTLANKADKQGYMIFFLVDNPEALTFVRARRDRLKKPWQIYFWYDKKVRQQAPAEVEASQLLESSDGGCDLFLAALDSMQSV